MAQLYRVGNPIDREERANLNLTLDDIQSRFSLLQIQVNFLAGGTDTQALIQEIRQAIEDAEQATENVDNAIVLIDAKIIELESEIEKAKDLTGKGEWNSTTDYLKNNIVTKDGNSYLALSDNTNVPVTNTSTWMLLAAKGDTGKGLSIKGVLNSPSELPASGEDGDAYYIGTNLWGWVVDQWVDYGQIKGDKGDPGEDGSDADVTTANIESALGYTPANQTLLDSFKGQYEFRTATIFNRQIRITKPDSSNRIPIFLNSDFEQGGPITVSLDSGSTSTELKNVDGTDVTKLDKGFIEIVETGSFFTLRNKGGLNQSELDALITLTNEADVNDSTLRSEYIDSVNSLTATGTLPADASWNDILLELNDTENIRKRFKTGIVTAPTGAVNFQYYSNTTNATQFRAVVSDLGFKASHIVLTPNTLSVSSFVTEYYQSLGGYTEYIKQSIGSTSSDTNVTNRGFKAQSQSAYVDETGFSLPVTLTGSYTYYAYE